MATKSKYIDEKTIHAILKPYAYKVFKDLSTASYIAIDEFYSDYQPKIYQRTFGMKNLFKPSMKKINNGYRIEFTYSVDYLTTDHRSNNDVFDGSFIHGYHGGQYAWGRPKNFVPQMQPSPWELLEEFAKTYRI